MINILASADTINRQHLKTDFTEREKQRRKLEKDIIDKKRIWHHSIYECFEHIGPFKGKELNIVPVV